MARAHQCVVAAVCTAASTLAIADASNVVLVEIENISQSPRWVATAEFPNGLPTVAPTAFPLIYAFHSGDFDFFDLGQPASEALGALAKESLPGPLIDYARSVAPDAIVNMITNNWFGYDNPIVLANFRGRPQILDPIRHRYFSFVSKLNPSDDAIVGTDDPQRYEVFDAQGKFLGPFTIEVFGSDVLDAGVRANAEVDVQFISERGIDLDAGVATSDPVAPHPGYIGSLRNPDGEPGILGVEGAQCGPSETSIGCFRLTQEQGDFTQPGYLIARIRLSSGLHAAFDGAWYDPRRSGEGFSVSVLDTSPKQLGVTMYTYAPDGSGEQYWLSGAGPITHDKATVEMYSTGGGGFGSQDNPDEVSLVRWGTITFEFRDCDLGHASFSPESGSFEGLQEYFLHRVAPPSPEAAKNCGLYPLRFPEGEFDNTLPTSSDFIEPAGQ